MMYSEIVEAADLLGPNGARTSAGLVLNEKLDIVSWNLMALQILIHYTIQDSGEHNWQLTNW